MAAAFEATAAVKRQRINVVGTSGSGKTTFARELAALLDLPHYEMDRFFWKPGWQPASDAELFRKVDEVTSQPRWVLDGNCTRTLPIKWKRVSLAEAFLSRKSILWWAISAHGSKRRRYGALMTSPEHAHIEFLRLTSLAQGARFLDGLRGATARAPG